MKDKFKKAHQWVREIKNEYPEVDYKTQFNLCLSALCEKEESDWDIIDKALDKCVAEEFGRENGWYTDWYASKWEKYGKKRTYFKIKSFRNGKLRSEKDCGYYDHIEEKYIAKSPYHKVYNIIEYYYGKSFMECAN